MTDHINSFAADGVLQAPVTVDAFWVRRMLEPLRAHGCCMRAAMAKAKISVKLLEQANARISGEQYATLIRLIMEQEHDEGLGFFSRPLKPGSFALIARYAAGARTLAQAIRRGGRALELLQDDVTFKLAVRDHQAGIVLRFHNLTVAEQAFLHDLMLRVFWQFYVWLAGGTLRARRFDLAYPRPQQEHSYRYVFAGTIVFDAPASAVWFDAEWLTLPLRRDDATVCRYLANAQHHIILPRRIDDVFSARVLAHLQSTQPTWPGLAEVAAALHISTATLQRRLADESTTFRTLTNELRRDLAITLLAHGNTNIKTLAQQLGFETTRSFQRAFKRWTGQTPSAYRAAGCAWVQ